MALLTRTHTLRRSRTARLALAAVAVLIGLVLFAQPVSAQKATQDELKAAFVFQFANYVQWPETSFKDEATPIVIGIAGNQDMSKTLAAAVRGKTVGSRAIQVVDVADEKSADACQILFIDAKDDKKVDDFLATVRTKPILTVSDDDNFTSEGGVIRLFLKDSKLRIEINIDEAQRSGLTISSKLLSLAQVVRDNV